VPIAPPGTYQTPIFISLKWSTLDRDSTCKVIWGSVRFERATICLLTLKKSETSGKNLPNGRGSHLWGLELKLRPQRGIVWHWKCPVTHWGIYLGSNFLLSLKFPQNGALGVWLVRCESTRGGLQTLSFAALRQKVVFNITPHCLRPDVSCGRKTNRSRWLYSSTSTRTGNKGRLKLSAREPIS